MAKWIAVFAFCSVAVFAQSTLPKASYDVGQEVMDNYRPTSETVARKHANKLKSIRQVRIEDVSAGSPTAHKTQFDDGSTDDQTYGK
jgi:ABC-type sulfate transport system substrate-binding protein